MSDYEIKKYDNGENEKDLVVPIIMMVGGAALIVTGGGFVFGLILLICGIDQYGKKKKKHEKQQKKASQSRYYSKHLIPAMQKAFGERFMVERSSGISLDHVWKSGLFVKLPNCERKGLAGANYRGIDAKLGWIETFSTEQKKDYNGTFRYIREDRFRGVLMMIQTKQTAPCALKILGQEYPDKEQLCDAGMFRMIAQDAKLNEDFVLLTDDSTALETLLTPEHSQAICKMAELCGNRKFAISWRGHLCYVAWESYENQLDLPDRAESRTDGLAEADQADRVVYYVTDFVDTCGEFIW